MDKVESEACKKAKTELLEIGDQAAANIAKWGVQEIDTLVIAISEQSGKVSQAYLHSMHEPNKYERGQLKQQARHTAALCLQLFITLEAHGRGF